MVVLFYFLTLFMKTDGGQGVLLNIGRVFGVLNVREDDAT